MLPTAWTFSSLEKFETCPKQYYHTRVKRDVIEGPTEATKWGERVHTAMENRVTMGEPLPEGMEHWEGLAAKLEALPGEKMAEIKMAVNDSFQACDWKSAWSRGIADLVVVHENKAIVLDYKTGKRKPSEQLALYAGYTFAHFPDLEEVQTGFVWLKDKKIDKQTVTRVELPMVWQQFLPRVSRLESAYERDSWQPKPSGLCKGWCPVKTCEFYKDK